MQDLVLSLPMVQTPSHKDLFNSGDFGTLTTERECWRLQGYSEFQSPYGDFGTLTIQSVCRCPKTVGVSVPLRGLRFLTTPHVVNLYRGTEQFPSPYGDCGS